MGVIADSGLLGRGSLGHETWILAGESETWVFPDATDGSGFPFNYAGLTATECYIIDKPGGTVVLTPTCTWSTVGGKSRLTIHLDDSDTAALLPAGTKRRDLFWYLRIKDVADTKYVWRSGSSPFHVEIGS